ncbi:zona pellucida sperm-binding protein 3-like [Gadus macrocephalus]|uniref:zona pellucida sperm-binding protein 3-like n=1 Tax=Gadus macrocephalus TaxID=80720 RepID=UPI0028CB808E|nr:zona pellucida sperm-binding protein 3-like [Gadus macrocephalus]
MVMKGIAVCLALAALAMVDQCNAQKVVSKPAYNSPQKIQKPGPPQQVQAAKGPQEPVVQTKAPERPIVWAYPIEPVVEPKPEAPFVPRPPVVTNQVAINCRESDIQVRVKTAFFGGGKLKSPYELTLGPCPAVGFDDSTQSLIFESDLQGCESNLRTYDDYLIYSFMLSYNPQATGSTVVVRAITISMLLECHYPRMHNVSSLALNPIFTPFSAIKVSEELLHFSFVLKTEDWLFERPSYQYFLADMIYLEATVKQFMHKPLRVFVDHCVASASPGGSPEYVFIENYGCFVDAQITGSPSTFLPRENDVTLRFQMEAFRIQGSTEGMVYLTCHLKATCASVPIGEQNRACSWMGQGWTEASGVNGACGSCGQGGGSDLSKPSRKGRSLPAAHREVVEWETTITLDPIRVFERTV